jgi:hypothetical protein
MTEGMLDAEKILITGVTGKIVFPVAVAQRLKPVVQEGNPHLAAPFHTIVPYEWDRYVP